MVSVKLPEHPDAKDEYLHLQETCDTVDREIREVETLTGAKAGVEMDVQMKEDPDTPEEVALQMFQAQLDRLRQLHLASQQAYFARLDFIPMGENKETWYLGRWGVLNPMTLDPVIVDWRSPVANLYYSGQIGPMDYEAPDGQVQGELTLKRMLTVRRRELVSLFDSGIVSQEAYLQEVLGSVSTDRLREIVTTIQAEQNIVIRFPLNTNLMVQGSAGSGKTTIALHRIAYLLYTCQKTLKPENMMILAPNPLFLSYISQVLPDLGVERVVQTTFEGWCRSAMGARMPKVRKESRIETNLSLTDTERRKAGSLVREKGSLRMMKKLESYLENLQIAILPERGFRMAGVTLMDREELEKVFLQDLKPFPIEERIGELKKIIRRRVQNAAEALRKQFSAAAERQADRIRGSMADGSARQQKLRELYTLLDQRYREIDERAGNYLKGYREKFPPADLVGIYRSFLQTYDFVGADPEDVPEDGKVRQEDLPVMAMICRAVFGLKTRPMKHIVIDECQDFSPFQIELLRQVHPAATFTLVGDLYQGIRTDEGIRNWSEWTEPVFHGKADLKQLTVSYRNTTEIMEAAQKVARRYPIAGITETRPVLRHGKSPEIIAAATEKERLAGIIRQIREWKEEGFHSIALITKTRDEARKLLKAVEPEIREARILTETETEYSGGVMILPASLAKGMEFDCVGIPDAGAENFPEEEFLSRVLYVMMTRPLHRLCLWYRGKVSPMLDMK